MLQASLYFQSLPQVLEIWEARVNKAQGPTRTSRTSVMEESSLLRVNPGGLRLHVGSGDDGVHYRRSRVHYRRSRVHARSPELGVQGPEPNSQTQRLRSGAPYTHGRNRSASRSRVSRVGLPEPRALPQAPLTGFANKSCRRAPDSPLREGLSHRPRAEP